MKPTQVSFAPPLGVVGEATRRDQERASLRASHARQKDADRRAQTYRATFPVFVELRQRLITAETALQDATSSTAIEAALSALESDFQYAVSALRDGAASALGKDS